MNIKWRRLGVMLTLSSMLLGVSVVSAEEVSIPWKAEGWWQWHPHEGEYMIGKAGTQLYFSPGDPVEAPPPVQVAEVAPAPTPVLTPPDSDGDGIPDDRDRCPGTPKGTVVDATGCDPDPDGDGVRREDDRCPNTPAGVVVNAQGCWIIGKILFRFDKADVQKKFKAELKKVTEALSKYPGMQVDIQGHTDSVGTPQYNDKLSLRRAESVKKSLLKLGLAKERLSTSAFGETQPVNKNANSKERALNRRVEILSKE
ncbi:MAG: OmpA family protein [Magnetococcales bacterium]|nr:OmpA family protein [Magnetococcales bacterium]MBF0150107.1 OmpA family protein [Magnetococcales bacterium]MBF0172840.1 OmpA family protein [Magnetococcales bacterium]MBF0347664.1 OmpA family protein [Magnetococcales bacterium]MBF0631239.1 OmpA family protein [Magnetococcales bacterium]